MIFLKASKRTFNYLTKKVLVVLTSHYNPFAAFVSLNQASGSKNDGNPQ